MKKHDNKRIEIVPNKAFTPAEIETLQQALKLALESAGTNATIAVSLPEAGPWQTESGTEAVDREMEASLVEPDEEIFEEALHCVEAL